VADSHYVKAEGRAGRLSHQMMAIVCTRLGRQGKVYLSTDDLQKFILEDEVIRRKINKLCNLTGLTVPNEPMDTNDPTTVAGRGFGVVKWADLFNSRQMMCLLSFAESVRGVYSQMLKEGHSPDSAKAVGTFLAMIHDRLVDFSSTGCTWNYTGGRGTLHTMARQAIPMTWDYAETNPFNLFAASWISGIEDVPAAIYDAECNGIAGIVERGTCSQLPWEKASFNAIITDPPYYDNISYAVLSDFFYVWLKRTVGHIYPEHFATKLTPKKSEAIADVVRHGGKEKSRKIYNQMMAQAFNEGYRVLKPDGQMIVVYAHKTTLGWATLVDALRSTGFVVNEAWPLDTERSGRLVAMNTAALVSSIFLVARKRSDAGIGSYEDEVSSGLQQIVQERVDTLWKMGITGADLVIAAVGAGLRAFTRFVRVEYANGEEVPAERFLAEVETVVLETILKRLSREVGANAGQFTLEGVDPATRFYILWRYTYEYSVLDAGEAIVFANGTHVELDGPNGLSTGARALLEKKKGKYTLNDYTDRGSDEKLGQMMEDGQAAPMVDALHRTLWLMENRPGELPTFLQEAQPNREEMRLVAQALAGPALKGGELGDISPHAELSALSKLTANWKSVIEGAALTPLEKKERETGQRSLFK
jgi:putative DNA methylase